MVVAPRQPQPPASNATPAPAQNAQPEQQEKKKRGFWGRLFGRKPKDNNSQQQPQDQ